MSEHEAWEAGRIAGEKFERSLWQWQAGTVSRAVNGLYERPERPENPYPQESDRAVDPGH